MKSAVGERGAGRRSKSRVKVVEVEVRVAVDEVGGGRHGMAGGPRGNESKCRKREKRETREWAEE